MKVKIWADWKTLFPDDVLIVMFSHVRHRNVLKTLLLSAKQILFAQQCSPRWANKETMIRKHNVTSTMFLAVDKQVNINRKHNIPSTLFLAVDKQGNIDRKDNLTSTMFLEVDKQVNFDRKHNVTLTMFLEVDQYEISMGSKMFC